MDTASSDTASSDTARSEPTGSDRAGLQPAGSKPAGSDRAAAESVRTGDPAPAGVQSTQMAPQSLDQPPKTGNAAVDAVLTEAADISETDPATAEQRLARAHEALHGIIDGRESE